MEFAKYLIKTASNRAELCYHGLYTFHIFLLLSALRLTTVNKPKWKNKKEFANDSLKSFIKMDIYLAKPFSLLVFDFHTSNIVHVHVLMCRHIVWKTHFPPNLLAFSENSAVSESTITMQKSIASGGVVAVIVTTFGVNKPIYHDFLTWSLNIHIYSLLAYLRMFRCFSWLLFNNATMEQPANQPTNQPVNVNVAVAVVAVVFLLWKENSFPFLL